MAAEERKWKCWKCNQELVKQQVLFTYLGHTFSHDLPTCPKCRRVFIPKELAEGAIAEVEEQLEDK